MSNQKINLEERFGAELPVIQAIGLMMFDPIWAEKIHPSHNCELLHVVAGSFDLITENTRLHAGPGDTLLVPSEMPHRDEFDLDKGLDIFYCSFSWKPAKEYFTIVANETLQSSSAARKAELSTLFDQLRADPAGPGAVDKLITRARVLTILLLILRETLSVCDVVKDGTKETSYRERRSQSLMIEAKTYLQKHYGRAVSLDEIASALHVSSYHLSHVFSQESDFSLFSYLTTLRMEKAQALLLERKLNVSEVARAVGYQNPNYFSKAFRKYFDCSPREFAASSPPA